jgi:hypothetical protein
VDHAVLYEAASPLPPTEPRFEEDVRLVYAGDGGPRRVEVSRLDGGVVQPIVRIDLDRPTDRGASRTDRTLHGGVALAMVSGYALWPDAEHVTPDDLALRGLPRFDQAETRHVRTSRRAPDPTVSDLIEACKCKDCSAGGPGSRTCTVKCSGRMIVVDFGEDCAVECGEGYYACCTCKGLFGSFGSCECVSN